MWRVALVLLFALCAQAQSRKLLYVTVSAGFAHDSIAVSEEVLRDIGQRNAAFDVTVTHDVSLITAETLRGFDGVFFYTSGELPLSAAQKQALLDYVRNGKGFGGVHSATDTNYTWPEYGEMIGGVFDGHPWTQPVRIVVEDNAHPATRDLPPAFTIQEEIYQFRNLSRERVRVLMTLDTQTVDLKLAGVNHQDGDFPLAWVRQYGTGRVFYSALGHFNETWRDARFQQHLLGGIRWLLGDVAGSAEPRPRPTTVPAIETGGVVNAATFTAGVAGGGIISIFGRNLTAGDSTSASALPLPTSLAGTSVAVDGRPAPLYFVSPTQINAQLPVEAQDLRSVNVVVTTAGGSSTALQVQTSPVAAGVFSLDGTGRGLAAALHADGRAVNAQQPAAPGEIIQIFVTGLGATTPAVANGAAAPSEPLARTLQTPAVTLDGIAAEVRFSGLAPGFAGLNQVNVVVPAAVKAGTLVQLNLGGSNLTTIPIAP